jgi:hypothetical protein
VATLGRVRRILVAATIALCSVPGAARAAEFAAPQVYGESGSGILRFP